MTEGNYPKSLLEVWEWKARVYEKTKGNPDKARFFEEDSRDMIKRLGLKKYSYKSRKTGTE